MVRKLYFSEETYIDIDDRVNSETSLAIDFWNLVELCAHTGIYPEKIIIRYATKKELNGDKPAKDKDPTFAYVTRGIIVILIDKKKNRPYYPAYMNWMLAHEHRHLQQLKIDALRKQINQTIKSRQKRTPCYSGADPDMDWALFRELVNWRCIIEEADAYNFASEWCKHIRPRRIYDG